VRAAAGEVVWRLDAHSRELFSALAERASSAASMLLESSGEVPAARSIDPFEAGDCVRPYRHLRAFYRRLGDGAGVLGYKGTEIQADDLAGKLLALGAYRVVYPSRGKSLFSALEHFPLVEQKIPLAVSLIEAQDDAESALTFQAAHLARFGALARAPVPLLIVRWPEPAVTAFMKTLLPLLSKRAARIVESVSAGGLGCLVYWYPCVPLRVAHLDAELASRGVVTSDHDRRRQALDELTDPRATVDSWVELVARMLVLGFLPSSIESHGTGHCLEAQNACLDGGFVDLASMKATTSVADEREFYETLLATLIDLSRTVRIFLAGDGADATAEYWNPTLPMMLVGSRIREEIRQRVAAYADDGAVDPRLSRFFAARSLFDELDGGLGHLLRGGAADTQHATGPATAARKDSE
jgi:hypothetical protein